MNTTDVGPLTRPLTTTAGAGKPPERYRVALVNTLFAPFDTGGAARSVRELALDLAAVGHIVQVHTLAPRDHEPAIETVDGVEIVRLRSDASFAPFTSSGATRSSVGKLAWHLAENSRTSVTRHLSREFERFQPDLVHTNNLAGFGIATWELCRDLPLVHTVRDYYLLCARSQLYRRDAICQSQCRSCAWLKAPIAAVERRPDIFVGVSQDIVARHRALGAIRDDEETAVVHNWPAVQPSTEPSVRRTDGASLTFGVLGTVHRTKGTWTVIKAFADLPDDLRRASRLLIAGPVLGIDRSRLFAACAAMPELEYVGHRVDPVRFFETVDVALVPSQWHEPFGRVAAEARLLGAAVIASRAGGLPEAVAAFGGGRLIDNFERPAAWTTALADAIRLPPARHVGQAAALTPVGEQYCTLYRRARGSVPSIRPTEPASGSDISTTG